MTIKHRMKGTPEYAAWHGMKDRCKNQNTKQYKNYGGRGIKVDDGWDRDFLLFYEHVGPKPSPLHSLGRIDNDGDYAPGNVRWEDAHQQQNNTRGNRIVTYKGEEMTVAQAIRAAGGVASRTLVGHRLRMGWSVDLAVETPPDPKRRKLKFR